MLIENFLIYRLQIPFSLPVSHNLAHRKESEALIVAACSPGGVTGFGEGTPRAYVTGEDIETSIQVASEICGMLKGVSLYSFAQLESNLDEIWNNRAISRHPSAFCAVELAVLDLYARVAGRPLWNLFAEAPAAETFIYSAVVPMLREPRLTGLLEYIRTQNIPYAKIKVSDVEGGREYAATIRRRVGDGVNIRVDANGAFSWQKAVEFLKLTQEDNLNISAIEQPTAADDYDALKKVTQHGGVPVFADESFRNQDDMRRLMDKGACSGFNIRLSKCGGFRNSFKLYQLARKHGFACQIGCHVGETAILASAGRHLAALCGEVAFLEGSYSRHVLEEDVSEEEVTFGAGGRASLMSGAGTGITIDSHALERWATLVKDI